MRAVVKLRRAPMATLSGVRGPSLIPAGNNFLAACRGVSPAFKVPRFPTSAIMLAMPLSCSLGAPKVFASLLDNTAPAIDFNAPEPALMPTFKPAFKIFPYCAALWRIAEVSMLVADSGTARLLVDFSVAARAGGWGSISSKACESATPAWPSMPA